MTSFQCMKCQRIHTPSTTPPQKAVVGEYWMVRCHCSTRLQPHRVLEGKDVPERQLPTPADLRGLTAHARNTDPETSHEAAASVTRIRRTQQAVLTALEEGPKTDEEVWDHLVNYDPQGITYTPSGLRTRRSELVTMGRVRDSGERRLLRTGRRAIVWEVTPT